MARVKSSFSKQHLRGATFLAQQAVAIEQEGTPVPEKRHVEHRAYVTSAVLSAVAALEASANELHHEVIGAETKTVSALEDRTIKLMVELWHDTEMAPILQKYQRVLLFADRPPFDTGKAPYQDVDSLIKLRENLVHYKPEWDDEKGRHHTLQQRLKGKFPLNSGPAGLLWFPHQCLSAGCASWATRVVSDFMTAFCDRMNIPKRFP